MKQQGKQELWPVMITPFTDKGEVDFEALERLIHWYEENGADGLFADCQSSEIFYLSLRERVEIAKFCKQHAHIPVIASGHVSEGAADQLEELKAIAATGVDALILITNRLIPAGRQNESILPAVEHIMKEIPEIPLGFYECPQPFKRLITLDELKWCAERERFAFMKDTCCDIAMIRDRLNVLSGSNLKLYNANTTTALESMRLGAAGFSGVMLNFHPDLYRKMADIWEDQPEKAETIQAFLTVFSEIERQYYPVNAKYHLTEIEHVLNGWYTRRVPAEGMSETFKDEVRQLNKAAHAVRETICR